VSFLNYNQQDATIFDYLFIYKRLYMFHPIHDTSLQQYWLTIPEANVQLCAPDDGRTNRPKHVEHFRNR